MLDSTPQSSSKTLAWILSAVFVTSLLMGVGPGVLLVNRAESLLGVPLVYAWGIFWYLVQVVVAIVAYFKVWRDEPDAQASTPGDKP